MVPAMDHSQLPNEEVRRRCSAIPCVGFSRGALERRRGGEAISPAGMMTIWTKLVGQGVASLGCDVSEGGPHQEILVVMAELGRAGCPVPM